MTGPDSRDLIYKKVIYKIWIYQIIIYICSMVSNDLLKGTLKTIVLSLLEEKGRMYGYEITQEVERLTKGKVQQKLNPNT